MVCKNTLICERYDLFFEQLPKRIEFVLLKNE